MASSLNTILYVPEHNLTINEKKDLVSTFINEQKYPLKIKDTHQRDALAAVLKAFNFYAPKFEKVDKELDRLELDIPAAEIKALVVKGFNIHNAIKNVSEKYLLPASTSILSLPKEKGISHEEVSRIVNKLTDEIIRLKHLNEKLRFEKKELEYKLIDTEEALQKILSIQGIEFRKTKLYESLIKRIEGLEQEKEKLKEDIRDLNLSVERLTELFKEYIEGKYIVVYPIEIFNKKTPSQQNIIMSLNNTVNPEYMETLLKKIKPRAIIVARKILNQVEPIANKINIPVIPSENIYKVKLDDYYIVDKEKFEIEYRKAYEKISVEKEKLESKIKKILEDYRRRRIKELDEIRKD